MAGYMDTPAGLGSWSSAGGNPFAGGGGGSPMLGMSILGGLSGLGSFFSGMSQAKAQKEIEKMRIAEQQRQQQQDVALKESTLDPFRQQMQQARNLSMLDMRGNYQPTASYSLGPWATDIYRQQAPGTAKAALEANPPGPRQPNYTPSADLLNWLSMIKQNVAGGQNQAPSMTSPGNYGKTSALDLLALQSDPTQAGYARGANFTPRPLTNYAVPRTVPRQDY